MFACMGFLEAAEVLLGGVEAHFDWSEAQARFVLSADGNVNPFAVVLEFLSKARISEMMPIAYVEGGSANRDNSEEEDNGNPGEVQERIKTPTFPSGEGDRNALPIQLVYDGRQLIVSHWADGSSRDDFKLYSGNRSANRIATQMLQGVFSKPNANQLTGSLSNRGLQQLWQEQRESLLEAPFDLLTPMGGSFNFDPRGAWTAIDAGYSPNTQKDCISASPVVEILAAIGLEHARPDQYATRKVRYAVWGHPLPPMLGRAALAGAELKQPKRRFEFKLELSGKNKVTMFAEEDNQP